MGSTCRCRWYGIFQHTSYVAREVRATHVSMTSNRNEGRPLHHCIIRLPSFFQRWHRHRDPNGGGRNEDGPGRAGQGQRQYQLFSWPRPWSETRGLQHLTPIVFHPQPLKNHHLPITSTHRRTQQGELPMPGAGGCALHQVYSAKVWV